MIRTALLALCALAATVALAACGEQQKASTTSSGDSATTSGDAGGAGGTLTVTMAGDIDDFDPHTNQLIQYEWAVRENVFDALVAYDENLEIVPELAQFEQSEDARSFTFRLDPRAVFSDGAPVNADAVVRSLRRAGSSKGVWAARLAGVASYRAPDEHTVMITLREPNAAFLDGLTRIAIVAPSGYRDARRRPVGSGPFTFESWTPNSEIVLKRNPRYWGEMPAYETLVIRPVADEQVALNDLYSGSVDVVGAASTDLVRQADRSRVNVVEPSASNSIALVELMGRSGALADPRVRQAMAYAFDRDAIRKIAYGDRGESEWSPLPTGSWAYAEQEGYPYDVARARALLEEAGATGRTVTLELLTGNPEATKMARVWQQSLKEAGLNLRVRTSELSVWLDKYTTRDYDAIWNFFNVSGDPDSFFDIIMKPHLEDQYRNPEMQRLIAEAKGTTDQARRTEIYGELQKMLVDDLPILAVQSRPLAALTSKDVSGVQLNPLGWPLLAGVTFGGGS